MCGIAGILRLHGAPDPQLPAVMRMAAAMTHRGPDDEGYLLIDPEGVAWPLAGDDTPAGGRHVPGYPRDHADTAIRQPSVLALAHRRLAIQDLSVHGHQPLATADGRYWLVYNGELYNAPQLRRELAAAGMTFHGRSDTEVLLQAYAHWGAACLDRLQGAFAFAVWDGTTRTLFCARDRVGIKPFYYTVCNGQLLFGSDIKTLIASRRYRPAPDPQGLYLAMAFGIAPRPRTAFAGVRALPQGHWLRVSPDGAWTRRRYWRVPVGEQVQDMPFATAAETVEQQLQAAVERRLLADVPVGVFLSGGVDSTTVASMAAQQQPGICALTLGYEAGAPELDEVSEAAATARRHAMHHVVRRVDPDTCLDDLTTWIDGYEEPHAGLAANHVIATLAREQQLKVVLNGLGGDELFAGYPYYRRLRWWPLLRLMRGPLGLAESLLPVRGRRAAAAARAATPDRLHTTLFAANDDDALHALFADRELKRLSTPEAVHAMYADGLRFSDALEAFSYMDLVNYVGNHHVHRSDQFTMQCSVEARFPLLDHELVEAAFRIPSRHKLRGGVQKAVLREVARKYIDPSSLQMTKKGFRMPLAQWLSGPLRPTADHALAALARRPEIEATAVRRCQAQYRQGRCSPQQLWHLVALELWWERFIDAGGVQ